MSEFSKNYNDAEALTPAAPIFEVLKRFLMYRYDMPDEAFAKCVTIADLLMAATPEGGGAAR